MHKRKRLYQVLFKREGGKWDWVSDYATLTEARKYRKFVQKSMRGFGGRTKIVSRTEADKMFGRIK